MCGVCQRAIGLGLIQETATRRSHRWEKFRLCIERCQRRRRRFTISGSPASSRTTAVRSSGLSFTLSSCLESSSREPTVSCFVALILHHFLAPLQASRWSFIVWSDWRLSKCLDVCMSSNFLKSLLLQFFFLTGSLDVMPKIIEQNLIYALVI